MVSAEMASLLALAGSVSYGVGDFCGGLGAREAGTTPVVLRAQIVGFVLLLPLLPFLGGDGPSWSVLVWGLAGGLGGGTGLLLMFHGFATGRISVVAPVSALVAAATPVAVGIALGERPGVLAAVGMVVAVVAIIALSATPDEHAESGAPNRPVILISVLAGLGFAAFFVCLSRAEDGHGLWPLVGARVGSGAVLVGTALVTKATWRLARWPARMAAVSGGLDMLANALALVALGGGDLAVVSVLLAMGFAMPVLLARVVLHEPLRPRHVVGLAAAAVAVTCIAWP